MWIFGTFFFFLSFVIMVQLINICAEAPIAWPIAKLLDYVLGGNEAHTYKKAELKSFLQFHRHGEEPLRDDEISILNGVLELNNKSVEAVMTRMHVSSPLQRRGDLQ
jgi:CBS domain containing-hemolysin-like protein